PSACPSLPCSTPVPATQSPLRFFTAPPPPALYPLSLHDALPIFRLRRAQDRIPPARPPPHHDPVLNLAAIAGGHPLHEVVPVVHVRAGPTRAEHARQRRQPGRVMQHPHEPHAAGPRGFDGRVEAGPLEPPRDGLH